MSKAQDDLYNDLLKRTSSPEWAVKRAVYERKLSADDVVWNERLGRPLIFKETVQPDSEVERRAKWTARQEMLNGT